MHDNDFQAFWQCLVGGNVAYFENVILDNMTLATWDYGEPLEPAPRLSSSYAVLGRRATVALAMFAALAGLVAAAKLGSKFGEDAFG